jgi:hypothetical protein
VRSERDAGFGSLGSAALGSADPGTLACGFFSGLGRLLHLLLQTLGRLTLRGLLPKAVTAARREAVAATTRGKDIDAYTGYYFRRR